MKRLVVGILAHVDAGKTTLSEGLLYTAGVIDKLGRVDKRTSFFDTVELERERGITIFSKQATISYLDSAITLVDTPGHIDFSAEAERALSIQDYAILVISATDGVQSHTRTLWRLLEQRRIPTFIFINKTDLSDKTRRELMAELRSSLSPAAADFSTSDILFEESAGADERLMEEYFESGEISTPALAAAIRERRLFPCLFGSALNMEGVRELLLAIDKYTTPTPYSESLFGARVYKISRDKQGNRLTYMKITGGSLSSKDPVAFRGEDGEVYYEKAEQIRIYSADKYKSVSRAVAGEVCAVLGLDSSRVGMGLGFERGEEATLTPVLDYKMEFSEGVNPYEAYLKLLALKEEDPTLSLSYDERLREIRVRLMGDIQTEVLKRIIKERFSLDVHFFEGGILYRETIAAPVMGAGHFEPLRHYAEVHLLIEPLERGEGIVAVSDCSTDLISLNWQRLILSHVEGRVHKGVLTGSPLTDVKITLTAAKAHLKHTEGGDFRQATFRAVRQGLMKAESVLLEPTFDFTITLPTSSLGRAMTDIGNMKGVVEPPLFDGDFAILKGNAPVSKMRSYPTELRAYTGGEGKITLSVGKYAPCHNAEEVIAAIGYKAELDERNTANSVFCKAGSGYVVPWQEADALMHISPDDGSENSIMESRAVRAERVVYRGTLEEDRELMRIFESTYGKIKERRVAERVENSAPEEKRNERKRATPKRDELVIIDGYNFIFASPELKKIAGSDISDARDTLTRLMCDYSAFNKKEVIIVFDAYLKKGGEGSVERLGSVSVVYTKEAETADAYIERLTHGTAEERTVRVVTSDYTEQLMVLGAGGLRVSASEFSREMNLTSGEISRVIEELSARKR